jgi:hypothetical protein
VVVAAFPVEDGEGDGDGAAPDAWKADARRTDAVRADGDTTDTSWCGLPPAPDGRSGRPAGVDRITGRSPDGQEAPH